MPQKLTSLADLARLPFDDFIDVRSPSEFAEDHIPGAISLPVLSDDERAKVGAIYVQEDRFLARKIGAALVSRNAAAHLEGPLAAKDGSWRPLVYCWRGGQRSRSFAAILREIGWRVDTIEGGYKSYRRLVVKALYDDPLDSAVVVIDGGTGTAKTKVLECIAAAGGQVIDLEAMAEHRGSLFGPISDSQPSQKAFESRIASTLAGLDPARPVFVEAESNKIGQLIIPPMLWQAMIAGCRVRISAPLEARVGHLLSAYADITGDPARLEAVLEKLVRYHGREKVADWKALAAAEDFAALARELVTEHYDPRYIRMSDRGGPEGEEIALPDLADETLQALAVRLLAG